MKIKNLLLKSIAIVELTVFIFVVNMASVAAGNFLSEMQLPEYIQNYIPVSVDDYAESQYMEYVMCAYRYADEYNLPMDLNLNNIELGPSYVIFYPQYESQSAIIYYPIIYNNVTILTLAVSIEDDQWSIVAGNDNVEFLNSINFPQEYYIFYVTDNVLVAQNYDKYIACNKEEYEDVLSEYSLEQKILMICGLIDGFDISEEQFEISDSYKNNTQNLVQPCSGYDVNETNNIELKLFSPQPQMNYGMCWAAAVATTVNYIKTTSVSAFEVCNKTSIGYNEGAKSMYDLQYALSLYNIYYTHVYNKQVASWDEIKRNIKKKYPIIISGQYGSTELAHAVTIYGYDNIDGDKKILYWDSAGNNGAGARSIFKYNTYRFSSSGISYSWHGTLYK